MPDGAQAAQTELTWLQASLENAPRHVRRKVLRDFLARVQRGRCFYCDCLMDMTGLQPGNPALRPTLDHKLPQARGGTDAIENLAAACLACNNAKGDLTVDEFNALRSAGLR